MSKHNAPSVSYPVGRCAFVGWVLVFVTALAVGLQAGWAWAWWPGGAWVPWRWWAASGVWVLVLGWAWRHWWCSPVGWLIWAPGLAEDESDSFSVNGGWWWGTQSDSEGRAVVRVRHMLAAPRWALLHIALAVGVPSKGLWVWVQADSAPGRWLPLRRALSRHAF